MRPWATIRLAETLGACAIRARACAAGVRSAYALRSLGEHCQTSRTTARGARARCTQPALLLHARGCRMRSRPARARFWECMPRRTHMCSGTPGKLYASRPVSRLCVRPPRRLTAVATEHTGAGWRRMQLVAPQSSNSGRSSGSFCAAATAPPPRCAAPICCRGESSPCRLRYSQPSLPHLADSRTTCISMRAAAPVRRRAQQVQFQLN